MNDFYIRPLTLSEYPLLEEFQYHAIFQREGQPKLPREIIFTPEVFLYINHFGCSPDDCALVAEYQDRVVGIVWVRLLNGNTEGFGYVDNATPELAISLLPEFRGKQIGTALMKEMLSHLRKKGYKKCSLATQKDNYAFKMYKKVGFTVVSETKKEYIMVCELTNGRETR